VTFYFSEVAGDVLRVEKELDRFRSASLVIGDCQVDNMLAKTPHPVLLYPSPPPETKESHERGEIPPGTAVEEEVEEKRPFLRLPQTLNPAL